MTKKVLILDDSVDDCELLEDFVLEALPTAEITKRVSCFSHADDYLYYDIIVMDERIGPFSGSEICAMLRRRKCNATIILVSGHSRLRRNFDHFLDKSRMKDIVGLLLPDEE